MRTALAHLDLAAVLALLRTSAGLTQTELADLVPGWTQSMVARMESGKRGTLFDIRSLLAFADAIDMPREVLLPLILGDPDATPNPSSPSDPEESDVDRRSFNGYAAVAAAGLVIPSRVAAPPERVIEAHLRHLRSSVDRLSSQEQSIGGATLLDEALRLFNRARSMLDHSEYTERVGNQLVALSAELGHRAGFLAYDSGRQSLTRRLFTESILLADSAGDPVLRARVHASMALQCTHLSRTTGNPGPAREALRLLDRAAYLARHERSARLHTLLEMRRAPASALLGDEAGARKALCKARHELDRGSHDSDSAWAAFINEAEISSHEVRALRDLRKAGSALDRYQTIINTKGSSRRNQTLYQASFSATLLESGDTGGALQEALRTLPALENGVATSRALDHLRPLRRALDDEEFSTRFDALAQAMATT